MTDSAIAIASVHTPAARRVGRNRFFVWMTGLLAAIVLIGFAPSFYLHGLVPLPPVIQLRPVLPPFLLVHGTAMTLWFGLLLAQSLLVANGRVAWHRRLGWLAALDAVAVVVVGFYTSLQSVRDNAARALAAIEPGSPSSADEVLRQSANTFFVGNAAVWLTFATLVTAAILLRHRLADHKRLMLFSSLEIVSAAAVRLGFVLIVLGVAPDAAMAWGNVVAQSVPWLVLAGVVVHDAIVHRRLFPVTVWAPAFVVLVTMLAARFAQWPPALEWFAGPLRGGA